MYDYNCIYKISTYNNNIYRFRSSVKLIKKKLNFKQIENDLEITSNQFRHGQQKRANSLQNKIGESVPKDSVYKCT